MKSILILSLLSVVLCLSACGSSQAPTTITPEEIPKADPELQQKRLVLIDDLIKNGIFSKVETPGSLPHVWVTSKFLALDFDDKEAFISVVYAYYVSENPKYDMVTLYDNKTGKQIGVFAEIYGGLKMD